MGTASHQRVRELLAAEDARAAAFGARALGDARLEHDAAHLATSLLFELGNFAAAVEMGERAADAAELLGERGESLGCLFDWLEQAVIAAGLGAERRIAVARRRGDPSRLARALLDGERYEEAAQLPLDEDFDASILQAHAMSLVALDRPDEAAARLGETWQAQLALGDVRFAQQNFTAALRCYEGALAQEQAAGLFFRVALIYGIADVREAAAHAQTAYERSGRTEHALWAAALSGRRDVTALPHDAPHIRALAAHLRGEIPETEVLRLADRPTALCEAATLCALRAGDARWLYDVARSTQARGSLAWHFARSRARM